MMKWVAILTDGTRIHQADDDKSLTTDGKNSFYDVLQAEEMGALEEFTLYGTERDYKGMFTPQYGVRLQNGNVGLMQINGAGVIIHDTAKVLNDVKLHYTKINDVPLTVHADGRTEQGETRHSGYTLGFTAKDQLGEDLKHYITIAI